MKLYHYHVRDGNFGDDLNLWLWDEVLPGWREALPGTMLVGVGTLINDKLPRGQPKIIMGSGLGYGSVPEGDLRAECRFVAVRGPRSAEALGFPPEMGVVDPAVLVADLPAFQDIPRQGPPVFVPHVSAVHHFDWPMICRRAGVEFLSPQGEAKAVIRRLAQAPLVIAESMHAAILADAFRTPWHAVSMTPTFHPFKWMDWAESLGIDLTINPPAWRLRSRGAPQAALPEGAEVPHEAEPPPGERVEDGWLRRTLRGGTSALRQRMKAEMIIRQFRTLAAMQGSLSAPQILEARKAELRRRFAVVVPS